VKWTLDDSKLVYGVGRKDLHFLDISPEGDLCLVLDGHRITLDQVIQRASAVIRDKGHGRASSFTLRVPQLISAQRDKVLTAFGQAMKQQRYRGAFHAFYPLKANPANYVVREVLAANPAYGLEVGTKWELSLALNELLDDKPRLIMCNGVKDGEYVETIRQAIRDGHQTCISIEAPAEVKMVLERLPRDKLQLALRVKPYVAIESHWSQAAGRHGKFGLGIHDLLEVLELLRANHAEASVVAVNAHPGSQVLGGVSAFAEFLGRIYLYLREVGFSNVNAVDVGGGLPIDYDGHLESHAVEDYARAIVKAFIDVAGKEHPHPNILSEAGRVVAALHALLVIRILELRRVFPTPLPSEEESSKLFRQVGIGFEHGDDPVPVLEAWQRWRDVAPAHEDVDDLLRYERDSGVLKLQLRRKLVHSRGYEDHLSNPLAQDLLRPEYILVGDFSVFSGAIDHVLVDQYFPILPISHLRQTPATLVRLADITCDSDGEISAYSPPINRKRLFTQDNFPLTTTRRRQWLGFPIGDLNHIVDSYVVIALVGAYQDAIRMDPRLVGTLPNVELRVSNGGDWITQWLEPGPAPQEAR
jgi:arginine decarboxylase